jgi:DNA-binding PadR family transcriptional regulator
MKGFLTFLVLKMISQTELSGEQIRTELAARKGAKPSPGTIYPVLRHLAQSGLIEEIAAGGKEKRYRITKEGQKEIKRATEQFVCLFQDVRKDFVR